MIQFLLIIIFASLLVCLATQPHIINSKYSTRHDITRKQRASPEANHKCVIAIKFQNQELLLETLMKVSNPESPEYGQYLSRTEISSLISNPAATTAVVSYLRGQGFEDIEVSKYGEFITVQAPISKWEHALSTEFHHFDRVDRKGVGMQPVMRALAMTMPSELVPHVHAIFTTVQMPLPSIYSEPQFTPQSVTTQDIGSLTPQLLKSFCKCTMQINSSISFSLTNLCSFFSISVRFNK